jgi:hypothetical protein
MDESILGIVGIMGGRLGRPVGRRVNDLGGRRNSIGLHRALRTRWRRALLCLINGFLDGKSEVPVIFIVNYRNSVVWFNRLLNRQSELPIVVVKYRSHVAVRIKERL